MTEAQKKELERALWGIANDLRGKMDADEFRDYILGFIFYKYLSERISLYADSILQPDGITFSDIEEGMPDGDEVLEAVRSEAIDELGYFLKPSELFAAVAERGGRKGNNFILDDLTRILENIQKSTMGSASEEDFNHLFEDMDLGSTKLGRSVSDRNDLVAKVLTHLNHLDFHLHDVDSDLLGDAYEYLIGKFASGAGKKAGEFYTPQQVSTILARIVTTGKTRLQSVYDPTCGSGSLLLRVAREVSMRNVGGFFGQELNRTTYNLARMNMILHGVHYRKFELKQEDTLERPQHDGKFEAVVANPPFSANWSANPHFTTDDRFSTYGKLAPASKADFAFVLHMIHHLADNGTMAVILPHGALFRGGAEGDIRKILIEKNNYLDAVIGLPANIFYGTGIPTCILVFKKCRENPSDILFIDASLGFEQAKNQNILREQDINTIVSAYRNRVSTELYSRVVPLQEVFENDCVLNIARYVETAGDEFQIDLDQVSAGLTLSEQIAESLDKRIDEIFGDLALEITLGNNLRLLQELKTGIYQKLSAGLIRFRRSDQSNYPAWQPTKLSDLLSEHGLKSTGMEEVHSVSVHKGIINQVEHLGRSYAAASTENYNRVTPGDIVYTKSPTGEFPLGVVKQSRILHDAIVSPLYGVFKPATFVIGVLVDEFFSSPTNAQKYLVKVVQKGAKNTINVSNKGFLSNIVVLPVDQEEQRRVAELLTLISSKINLLSGDVRDVASIYESLQTRIAGSSM